MNGEEPMEHCPEDDLTPQRRRCLAAVAAHVAPPPDGPDGPERESLALESYVAHSLTRWPFAAQAPLAWALLDELDDRSSGEGGVGAGGFAALPPAGRETLLRALESDPNPYLSHALVLLVRLSIEASYGVEQGARGHDARM